MNGYYAGDNERNDYQRIDKMKAKYIDQENADIKLRHAPSVDFNHQIMKRKHTSQLDLEKAKKRSQRFT